MINKTCSNKRQCKVLWELYPVSFEGSDKKSLQWLCLLAFCQGFLTESIFLSKKNDQVTSSPFSSMISHGENLFDEFNILYNHLLQVYYKYMYIFLTWNLTFFLGILEYSLILSRRLDKRGSTFSDLDASLTCW